MQTSGRPLGWSLPCEPRSAGLARRHVADACSGHGRELHDVAVLLTTELVGNAVEHGRGRIHLVVAELPSRLRVEVHDDSPERPVPRQAGSDAQRGRGLMLVERLASEWGVDATPGGGKLVWFQLRLPAGPGF